MKKRIYLIVSEEPVFHPVLTEGIIKALQPHYEIAGITLTTGDTRRISPRQRALETLGMFGVYAGAMLTFQTLLYKLCNSLRLKQETFFSVRQVAEARNIAVISSDNVNAPSHIGLLRSLDIDVLFSSQGHIFKPQIITLPRLGCINRHTSLLPRYGGLWPVFWAMLQGESHIGQTIHTITPAIDEGCILAREKFAVGPRDSMYGLYAAAVRSAPALTLRALENLAAGKKIATDWSQKTYCGHPGRAEGRRFRRRHSFFTIGELLARVPRVVSAPLEDSDVVRP